MERSHSRQSWSGGVKLAVATGVAYFLAGRLGLVLRVEPGLAIFWPASGISVGVLLALGSRARLPVAAAVFFASAMCGLTIGRNAGLSIAFGFLNTVQTLLTTWLLEQWFERPFKLEDVRSVLGFFAATAAGSAIAAVGAVLAFSFIRSSPSLLHVWGIWFAASSMGIVTVAPLLIGLGDVIRERLPRHELMEGWAGLIVLTALTFFLISLPDGPWATALPEGLVFPFLLWIAMRCRPVFAAGAALAVGLTVIGSTALNVGSFDAGKQVADRILSAQTFVFIESILVVLLAAVFAERRRSEQAVKQVADRLQLALDGAALGAFSANLATGRLECDVRAAQLHGHSAPPATIKESRRFVHPEDLKRIDRAVAEAGDTRSNWKTEYRVVPPPGRPHAGETRWVAVESAIVCDAHGAPVQLLGVTRDITLSRRAEQALAERNTQLDLASKIGQVGSFAIDFSTGHVDLSPGCAVMLGLPESTVETSRDNIRKRLHPEDVARFDASRDHAFLKKQREFVAQFRIVRANDGEVRWIEMRGLILYDQDGQPSRLMAAIIDFTERKLAERALAERNAQLELASKAARVGSFSIDFSTGVVRLSPGCAAMYGLPEGTVERSRDDFRKRVRPTDWQRLEAERNHAFLTHQREFTAQFRIVRADDGEVRWLEARSLVIYGPDGKPSHLIGVNIDMTERKQAELALAERNEQLALAGQAALVGSYAYESDLEKMTVSEGYAAMHGLPEGTTETTRSQWRARVHPDDRERMDGFRARAFDDNRHVYNVEYRIIRGGEIRWIESRSIISYDVDGEPRRVIGINIDVTARKHIEALLNESRTRLSDALAAGQVVAFEWDVATGQSQRSDNADRIIGFVDGGRFLQQVHAEDRDGFRSHIRDLSPDKPTYESTFRFVRSDGRQVWLEETAKGEFNSAGRLVRIKGLTRDITERKELEDHKTTLISELDHRVKNVLATVSAVASRTQETSNTMAEFVAALDGRIKSMATTHELLSYRRWRGLPLAELVRRELEPYATASNTRLAGPDVVLRAEAGQTLAMMFHELATNAAKFGAFSTGSGRVCVSWRFMRNGHAESSLCIEWKESGGPNVVPPIRSGFGTSVVRELIPYELGGTVDLAHLPEGVRCNLRIPEQWLSAGMPPAEPSIDGAERSHPS